MLKFNINSKASSLARFFVVLLFIFSLILLILLWGVDWFSGVLLFIYIVLCFFLFYSLKTLPFQCALSDDGQIEIRQPLFFTGKISARSFFNFYCLFLCVEESATFLIDGEQKHNKPSRWFVVFKDSVDEVEYRLLARLITNARWS